MQYVWITTLLANVLLVTSSNVERPKRDLAFIKNIISNLFGYKTYNPIIANEDYFKILYPVSIYPVLMNAIPNPYMNQYIYQRSLPKILIPSNMVMQPVINFRRPNIPHIMAFDGCNYKIAYTNYDSLQRYGNMQKLFLVPNYNRVEEPLVRCNNEIPASYKKNVTNDKTEEVSSAFSKNESRKLTELQSLRDIEEISKEGIIHGVASSQSSQSKNITKTMITTPRALLRENQRMKTSTTFPSSTVNIVQNRLNKAKNSKESDVETFVSSQTPQSKNIIKIMTTTPRASLRAKKRIKTSTTSPGTTGNVFQTDLNTEEISKEGDVQIGASSQYPQSKKKIKTTTTPLTPLRENRRPKTSTIPPSSTVYVVQAESNTEEISKEGDIQEMSSSQPLQFKNISETPITTQLVPSKIIQLIKTSTISSTSTVSVVQTELNTEEISKEGDVQGMSSSQPPQSESINETSTSTPRGSQKKIQLIETSTMSPSSTVKVGQTNVSSFYAPPISTTELIQISISTLPTFSNVLELITPHTVAVGTTMSTSTPSSQLSVENLQKMDTLQPIVPPLNNKDEEIKPTSNASTPTIPTDFKQPKNKEEIKNNFNPSKKIVVFTEPIRTRFVYKKVNRNKPNEDTVFKMENIKYPNFTESQGDLMTQPSSFSQVIDVLNSIAPIRGKVLNPLKIYIPQDTEDNLEETDSDDMEMKTQSTEVYPSESDELDYLNSSPIIPDQNSYGFVEVEGSQNETNESKEGDSETESRGDVPDL